MLSPPEYRSYYDSFYASGDFPHRAPKVRRALLSAILRRIDAIPGMRVLELGCGTGVHLRELRERGFRVVGLDLSRVALERAGVRIPEAPLVQGNALTLPFLSKAFDLVLAFCCSLMNGAGIDTVVPFFLEAQRVCRPGGWVVATSGSDFSGRIRGGWANVRRSHLQELLAALPGDKRFLLSTFPRLGAYTPKAVLHASVHAITMLPISRRSRTLVIGARAGDSALS